MEKDEELLEEKTDGDEELFDMNLNDLSPDEIDKELGDDGPDEEEIIELTDLVEKGEKSEEVVQASEEEQLIEDLADLEVTDDMMTDDEVSLDGEEAFDQLEEDLDFSDISLESELGLEEGTEPDNGLIEDETSGNDLDKILEEGIEQDLEAPIEDSIAVEGSLEELIEETGSEEPVTQIESEPSKEEAAPVTLPREETIGISEERMEAIVARVVEDVVERVARETMTSVAERVITEAIDALKQSLEPGSD